VAIGIYTSVPQIRQRHVAIVYNRQPNETRLSHLAWDYWFRDELWDGKYLWQEAVDLEPENRVAIVTFLINLDRSRPEIPFGFQGAGCAFTIDSQDGSVKFEAGVRGTGLTCATFICLVFSSLKLPILVPDTWPKDRPEDVEWRTRTIERLALQVPADRLAAIKSAVADARIRPEELTASFVQRPWPVSFPDAEVLAREVIDELEQQLMPR
jgi:hypothetical protein